MNTNKIIFKNAFIIFAGIAIYFFLMKLLGLENISELRFLNFIFVFWCVNNAIKTNIKYNQENLYVNNFSVGAATSIVSVGITILGLLLYVGAFDPNFIEFLETSFFWGSRLSLPLVVFALAIEGIASSVTCSFILMQYYKNYKVRDTVLS